MVSSKPESPLSSPNPFDDEDSSHLEGDSSDSARGFSKWIRPSGMVAAISLVVAIIASVVSNNAAGDRNIEDLAFNVNRFAGVVMLLGCFGLLIGFRGEQVVGMLTKTLEPNNSQTPRNPTQSVLRLFLQSLLVSIGLAIAIGLMAMLRVEAAMIAMIVFYAFYFPLLVTSAVMRTGTARGYSIGMAANFLFQMVGYFGIFGVVWFQTLFWGPSRSFASPGYFVLWLPVLPVIAVCVTQALMIVSGLICAGYSKLLLRNSAIQHGSPELTTLSPTSASVHGTEASTKEFSVDPGVGS